MQTVGEPGAILARSRKNNSTSPMISTPAAFAFATVQCGSGCVSGTPGESTKAAKPDQSAAGEIDDGDALGRRLVAARLVVVPGRDLRAAGLQRACRGEPRAAEAEQGDRAPGEDRDRRHDQRSFSVDEADQRQHDGDDPEADHDLRLGPAQLLEMVVDRRHQEDALAGALEDGDLDDHRERLDDEEAADDRQHDLVLGRDRDGAEQAAKRRASRCRP